MAAARPICSASVPQNSAACNWGEDTLRPFAWVLEDAQPAASPGGVATEDAPLLQRYDLVYTFASVEDEEGARWYLIGAGQWLPAAQLAVVLPTQKPRVISRDRWLSVDLTQQVLLGYWQDTPQFATLVSSGIEGRATPLGVYEIWARLELDSMSGFTGAPDAYGLESVPGCSITTRASVSTAPIGMMVSARP